MLLSRNSVNLDFSFASLQLDCTSCSRVFRTGVVAVVEALRWPAESALLLTSAAKTAIHKTKQNTSLLCFLCCRDEPVLGWIL